MTIFGGLIHSAFIGLLIFAMYQHLGILVLTYLLIQIIFTVQFKKENNF